MFGFRHHPIHPPQAKPCGCPPFHPDIADTENPHVPLSARPFSLRIRSLFSPQLAKAFPPARFLFPPTTGPALVRHGRSIHEQRAARVTRFSADLPFIQWHGPTFHESWMPCQGAGRRINHSTSHTFASYNTPNRSSQPSEVPCWYGFASVKGFRPSLLEVLPIKGTIGTEVDYTICNGAIAQRKPHGWRLAYQVSCSPESAWYLCPNHGTRKVAFPQTSIVERSMQTVVYHPYP